MKKAIILAFSMIFLYLFSFAYNVTETVGTKILQSKTFKGKVDSVVLSDSSKDSRSEIVVIGDKGQKVMFVVNSSTNIYSKDRQIWSLRRITAGETVEVEYTQSKSGLDRALTISVIELTPQAGPK
jgi:hypothetical protein